MAEFSENRHISNLINMSCKVLHKFIIILRIETLCLSYLQMIDNTKISLKRSIFPNPYRHYHQAINNFIMVTSAQG